MREHLRVGRNGQHDAHNRTLGPSEGVDVRRANGAGFRLQPPSLSDAKEIEHNLRHAMRTVLHLDVGTISTASITYGDLAVSFAVEADGYSDFQVEDLGVAQVLLAGQLGRAQGSRPIEITYHSEHWQKFLAAPAVKDRCQ
jgi:hypothetical protein